MISSPVGSIASWWAHLRPRWPEQPASRQSSTQRQQLTALSLSADSSYSLRIQTDEGDTVTLTGQREFDLTLINYGERYRSGSEESRLQARMMDLSMSREFEITVEGSLSKEEQADVDALLAELRPAIARFLKTGAPVQQESLADGEFDSLAGYQLDLSMQRELDVVVARLRTDSLETIDPPAMDTVGAAETRTTRDLQGAIQAIVRRFFQEGAQAERAIKIARHALAGALDELRRDIEQAA
jgi:hypothetical protein